MSGHVYLVSRPRFAPNVYAYSLIVDEDERDEGPQYPKWDSMKYTTGVFISGFKKEPETAKPDYCLSAYFTGGMGWCDLRMDTLSAPDWFQSEVQIIPNIHLYGHLWGLIDMVIHDDDGPIYIVFKEKEKTDWFYNKKGLLELSKLSGAKAVYFVDVDWVLKQEEEPWRLEKEVVFER